MGHTHLVVPGAVGVLLSLKHRGELPRPEAALPPATGRAALLSTDLSHRAALGAAISREAALDANASRQDNAACVVINVR